MGEGYSPKKRERIDFSRIKTAVAIPNLIEVQKRSYDRFLQMQVLPEDRKDSGLQSVFTSVFPIEDFRKTCSLEFIEYSIGNWECKCGKLNGLSHLRSNCKSCGHKVLVQQSGAEIARCSHCGSRDLQGVPLCEVCATPVRLAFKYDVEECQERGMTYSVPLKVTIRLVMWDKDSEGEKKTIRDIKEQEVYFGDIPLMTRDGTFIINGTERVIVSQLHRSPGVFFNDLDSKGSYGAQIIPYRGSWVEFEYDAKNILYVRVDRKRKFLATIVLKALAHLDGVEESRPITEKILRDFYTPVNYFNKGGESFVEPSPVMAGLRASADIKRGSKVYVGKGKKITKTALKEIKDARIARIPIAEEDLAEAVCVSDQIDPETGDVLVECNEPLLPKLESLVEHGIKELEIFFPDRAPGGTVIGDTLRKDPVKTGEEACVEIYRRARPGDPPTPERAKKLIQDLFFNIQRYDLSRVGRLKMNTKLGNKHPLEDRVLKVSDFDDVITFLLGLRQNPGGVDDIDHLGNRRVRSVGELLENQFRIGLVRMERAIKEKMSIYQEMTTAMPLDLINAKPVIASIREFFGSSQLSQFMDQTNPLAEVTHKRRLSALGPGGLSRSRAGFEVRDVHPTHYGRICPIETPEGPNIGLISSLSCYARINEFGFIESPYSKVEDGRVLDYVRVASGGDSRLTVGDVVDRTEFLKEASKVAKSGKTVPEAEPFAFYLTAWEEDKYVIAQANVKLDSEGKLVDERVIARSAGDFILAHRDQVQYIDVSPKQLVSVAASLIPFLENDDANRALMGSNMQRQAVPLLRTAAPLVGTGMEAVTARDSGAVVLSRRPGTVDYVDSQRIVVRPMEDDSKKGSKEVNPDIYTLTKFKRSNQNTCVNQKPIVETGMQVDTGDVLADGPCTDQGELALGRDVLVAFMPWRGYNFEDAIVVSERLVRGDHYTSIHIEEFDVEARDTKLGAEEITRDIPNVSEHLLSELDESGIIRIGAYVKSGSILVGKVTPKGETQLTPEEKLLRAIFGEKAGDVRDASLVAPPGIEGIVVDVKIFSRKGAEKDARATAIEEEEIARYQADLNDQIRILREERLTRIREVLGGKTLSEDLERSSDDKEPLAKGTKLVPEEIEDLTYRELKKVQVRGRQDLVDARVAQIEEKTDQQINVQNKLFEDRIVKLQTGSELAPGVSKMVKVYVAMKRKMSEGDKMAGRHGNKGVIAKIVPEEDMPYLPDGRPIEVILNPLGVPSRMNVGQILETHLGWAAQALGFHIATPVFDGAREEDIKDLLAKADLPRHGKTVLFDGMTGEAFEQQVTVGYIYLLKLSHLVDDKIHARSIGPYSLITQQPLGGKAQFGGQRFGEMEVWALEAYGAAHVLQELLTAKSDDVHGRTRIYEAIVKGNTTLESGIPESFNVLVRELQSLALDVELLKEGA